MTLPPPQRRSAKAPIKRPKSPSTTRNLPAKKSPISSKNSSVRPFRKEFTRHRRHPLLLQLPVKRLRVARSDPLSGQRNSKVRGIHLHAGGHASLHHERHPAARLGARPKAAVLLFEQPLCSFPQRLDHQPPVFIEHPKRPAVLLERIVQTRRQSLQFQNISSRKLFAFVLGNGFVL